MRIDKKELFELMKNKLKQAGLPCDHAEMVADVLLHADMRGIHSHGAIRVEYYAERISKGGTNCSPNFKIEHTGPCSAIFHGDNAAGHVVAKLGMEEAIKIARENGVAIVGMKKMGHSGALSYFVQQAAEEGMLGISVCQSDPMAAPYGGTDPFFGTNPIAFASPSADGRTVTVDLAVTTQAWGKVLHARSQNNPIPDDWAIDKDGNKTTDPFKVHALNHIAGPKGYALAMMIDILSGVLLGLPFGDQVTSMYSDLSKPRNLGQMHIVIDPARFTDPKTFLLSVNNLMGRINEANTASWNEMVRYPGQGSEKRIADYEENGVKIEEHIYDYLKSDEIFINSYENKGAFAS